MHSSTNQCTNIRAVVLQNDTAFFTCEPVTYHSPLLVLPTSCISAFFSVIVFRVLTSDLIFDFFQISSGCSQIFSGFSATICTLLVTDLSRGRAGLLDQLSLMCAPNILRSSPQAVPWLRSGRVRFDSQQRQRCYTLSSRPVMGKPFQERAKKKAKILAGHNDLL